MSTLGSPLRRSWISSPRSVIFPLWSHLRHYMTDVGSSRDLLNEEMDDHHDTRLWESTVGRRYKHDCLLSTERGPMYRGKTSSGIGFYFLFTTTSYGRRITNDTEDLCPSWNMYHQIIMKRQINSTFDHSLFTDFWSPNYGFTSRLTGTSLRRSEPPPTIPLYHPTSIP